MNAPRYVMSSGTTGEFNMPLAPGRIQTRSPLMSCLNPESALEPLQFQLMGPPAGPDMEVKPGHIQVVCSGDPIGRPTPPVSFSEVSSSDPAAGSTAFE